MATKKSKGTSDEKKALKRYVDQPGQFVDTTPASVKKRQAKGWAKLEKMMKSSSKTKKGGKK